MPENLERGRGGSERKKEGRGRKGKRVELTPSQSRRIVSTLASISLSSEGVERCLDMVGKRRAKEGKVCFVGVGEKEAKATPESSKLIRETPSSELHPEAKRPDLKNGGTLKLRCC